MQVSSLNLISPFWQNKQKASRQQFCSSIDAFVRSTSNINTKVKWDQDCINAASDSFSDGILKLIENNQFNKENVKSLVKEIAPDSRIIVKDLNELKYYFPPDSVTEAVCISHYTSQEMADIESIIAIDFAKFNPDNKYSVINMINNTVHEFRHALNSRGEESPVEYLTKVIPNGNNAVTVYNNFRETVEDVLNINICLNQISEVNDEELLKMTECESIERMEYLIKECLCENLNDLTPENSNKIKEVYKYYSMVSTDEISALDAGYKAVKKYLKLNDPLDLDLRVYFFDRLPKYFDFLSLNCIRLVSAFN